MELICSDLSIEVQRRFYRITCFFRLSPFAFRYGVIVPVEVRVKDKICKPLRIRRKMQNRLMPWLIQSREWKFYRVLIHPSLIVEGSWINRGPVSSSPSI